MGMVSTRFAGFASPPQVVAVSGAGEAMVSQPIEVELAADASFEPESAPSFQSLRMPPAAMPMASFFAVSSPDRGAAPQELGAADGVGATHGRSRAQRSESPIRAAAADAGDGAVREADVRAWFRDLLETRYNRAGREAMLARVGEWPSSMRRAAVAEALCRLFDFDRIDQDAAFKVVQNDLQPLTYLYQRNVLQDPSLFLEVIDRRFSEEARALVVDAASLVGQLVSHVGHETALSVAKALEQLYDQDDVRIRWAAIKAQFSVVEHLPRGERSARLQPMAKLLAELDADVVASAQRVFDWIEAVLPAGEKAQAKELHREATRQRNLRIAGGAYGSSTRGQGIISLRAKEQAPTMDMSRPLRFFFLRNAVGLPDDGMLRTGSHEGQVALRVLRDWFGDVSQHPHQALARVRARTSELLGEKDKVTVDDVMEAVRKDFARLVRPPTA
jgi:hypothetical protein